MYVGLVLVSRFLCLTVKDHLTYFFVVGKGSGALVFFIFILTLHFLHFRVIFDYFLVIYGRGWWSNRRFGFVLFCVLCAHESSVLGFSFLFFFFFFSLQTVLSSIKILFLEAFSDLVFFQVQRDLRTCMHVSYLLSPE